MKIIAFPHKPGHGGPGSFQTRFEKSLVNKGYHVSYAGEAINPDLVFVVGGTKRLGWLLKMKLKRVPIIHRLDGLTWLHRTQNLKTILYGEWRNFLFKFIHGFLATHLVYQSWFVKKWWDRSGWRRPKKYSIIYNGVDLNEFKPFSVPDSPVNLLCVEGTLDYSPYAIDLLNYLQEELIEKSNYQCLVLYGSFHNPQNEKRLHPDIDYRGKVAREQLPFIYKNSVYLSLDVNAACPNTVVEAMACGLPVVGYDTGALKELLGDDIGLVDFEGNSWKGEIPNFEKLKNKLIFILTEYKSISKSNAQRANETLNLIKMSEEYMSIICQVTPN